LTDGLHVERAMEDGDEQAEFVTSRGVKHRLPCWEVSVRAWPDHVIVHAKAAAALIVCATCDTHARHSLAPSSAEA
jgi:hypothetical protein